MRSTRDGRSFADHRDEAWLVSVFRMVLIALMTGSLAVGPAVLREGFGGGWRGYSLPFAVGVAALAVGTTTLLGRPSWRDRRSVTFRLGELLLLILLTRELTWNFFDGYPQLQDIRAWLIEPGRFLTGEFLFGVVVLLMAWGFATSVTADFLELGIRADEAAARYSHEWGDSKSQWRVGRPTARTETLQRFALRWLGCGTLLVLCAAVTRVAITTEQTGAVRVGLSGLGMRPEVVAGLVCYFLSGLLLMSHGRLAVLRGRWFNQEVEVREPLLGRWHANSLVFVTLIALLALLLPLGSTGWLAQVIEWLIALVARVVIGIALAFGLLFSLIVALLRSLFGAPPEQVAPQAVAPPAPFVPSQAEMTARLPTWLGSAILWSVVVLVVGFLLVNYVQATGILESSFGSRLLQLRLWWRARQHRVSDALMQRWSKVRLRVRRERRKRGDPLARQNIRHKALLPRDKVRQYYLRAIAEAGEEGVARPPHKTPSEYAEDLRATWPETDADVGDLTSAFLDARYSKQVIDDAQASGAERAWRRLRRAIHGLRHTG